MFNLDASYQGEYVKVIELEAAFENYPTKLEISKTDITGEHELNDAVLSNPAHLPHISTLPHGAYYPGYTRLLLSSPQTFFFDIIK